MFALNHWMHELYFWIPRKKILKDNHMELTWFKIPSNTKLDIIKWDERVIPFDKSVNINN